MAGFIVTITLNSPYRKVKSHVKLLISKIIFLVSDSPYLEDEVHVRQVISNSHFSGLMTLRYRLFEKYGVEIKTRLEMCL